MKVVAVVEGRREGASRRCRCARDIIRVVECVLRRRGRRSGAGLLDEFSSEDASLGLELSEFELPALLLEVFSVGGESVLGGERSWG